MVISLAQKVLNSQGFADPRLLSENRQQHRNMDDFALSPKLPPEIRQQIWLLTIPDDQEEVCLCWPGDFPAESHLEIELYENLPVLPLTVDAAFPVAMHVCREARAMVTDSKLSNARFRTSHVAKCMTPFRCFRPELDVLYLGHDSARLLRLFADPCRFSERLSGREAAAFKCYNAFMNVLRRAKRLAVHIEMAGMYNHGDEYYIYHFLIHCVKTPKSLTFVFPCSVAYTLDDEDVPGVFFPPGKRCRLVTVPSIEDNGELLSGFVSRVGKEMAKRPLGRRAYK